jgi:plasmid replication initiation protein
VRAFELRVIYRWPRDYPGRFVVRQHFVAGGEIQLASRQPLAVADSLDDARRQGIRAGMVNCGRYETDDSAIQEVWL